VDLLIERERMAVAGVSSGGSVALGLALRARARLEVLPTFLLLIYPALDDRLVTPSSYEMAEPPMIGREGIVEGWSAYVSNEPEGNGAPCAAPTRARDLRGLPPTFMMVGELDLFRDETIECAKRLMKASVPAELHVYPGAFHGFETVVPAAEISKRATSE